MSSRRVLPGMALAACGALAACAGPQTPPPPAPPSVSWARQHHVGSAISGPTPSAAGLDERPVDPDAALQVHVRWFGLAELPSCFEPIGRRRRLLLDLRGADVLRAVPRLSAGARAALLDDADAGLATLGGLPGASRLAEQHAALPAGLTTELSATTPGAPGRVGLRVHRRLTDEGAGSLDVALVLEDARGGELVVLSPVGGERLALGLVVAAPIPGLAGLGAVIEVGPPPAPGEPGRVEHRAAYAACLADVAREAALARVAAQRDPVAPPSADDEVGLSRAVAALRQPAHRRGALFALGQRTGARLVEDVALGADDPLLEAVAAAAFEAATAPGAPRRGAGLGWVLERAALAAVASAAEDEPPSPIAGGLLVRAAGVGGAYPQTLRELAAGASDLAGWRARLVEANQAALDDPSPLQRILAAEWLASRGEDARAELQR